MTTANLSSGDHASGDSSSNAPHHQPLNRPSDKSFLVLALFLLVILPAAGGLMFAFSYWQRGGDFPRNRLRYEALVNAVKARGVQPGSVLVLQADTALRPESLRPVSAEESRARGGRGRIWARRLPDDRYQIALVVEDHGAAGASGYLYSEVELNPNHSPRRNVDVPGDLTLASRRLDTHWWAAFAPR